jgi:hypothetical protein
MRVIFSDIRKNIDLTMNTFRLLFFFMVIVSGGNWLCSIVLTQKTRFKGVIAPAPGLGTTNPVPQSNLR